MILMMLALAVLYKFWWVLLLAILIPILICSWVDGQDRQEAEKSYRGE